MGSPSNQGEDSYWKAADGRHPTGKTGRALVEGDQQAGEAEEKNR